MIVPDWVIAARGLIDVRTPLPSGSGEDRWERIAAGWPPVLEGDGMRGLIAPLVAAVAWAGAYFRELTVAGADEGSPALDPFALFMRLIAVGLTVRAILLLSELVSRLRVAGAMRRCYLALAPEGLYARLPDGEVWLEKDDIAAIVEPGNWQGRRSGRRFSPVFVVSARGTVNGRDVEGGKRRSYIALPPLFLETAGVLAEHLSRWRGAIEEPEGPVTFPEPETLGSKVYDDAAAGKSQPGTLAIEHGRGWMRAGPWASAFLAIVALDGYLRASPSEQVALGVMPLVIVCSVAVLVPIGWLLLTKREIDPRKGLALVLTPAEMMLRTRSGVMRVRWSTLLRTTIDQKQGWSILEGIHPRRTLTFKRKNMEPIHYEEAFLGVPVEVAQVWLDGYRRGVLPAPSTSPEPLAASAEHE
jgi:hypothetical protein